MALYFDDMLLEEIRQRNDIVDLISMYTDLKQSGNRLLGLCPFHKEKTPSFLLIRTTSYITVLAVMRAETS